MQVRQWMPSPHSICTQQPRILFQLWHSHRWSSSPQCAVQWHQTAWGLLLGDKGHTWCSPPLVLTAHSTCAHAQDKKLLWAGTCTVVGDMGVHCGAVGCCSVTFPLKRSCPPPVPRAVCLRLCGVQSGNDAARTGLCFIYTPKRFYFKSRKNPYKLVGLGGGSWAMTTDPVLVPGLQPGVKDQGGLSHPTTVGWLLESELRPQQASHCLLAAWSIPWGRVPRVYPASPGSGGELTWLIQSWLLLTCVS